MIKTDRVEGDWIWIAMLSFTLMFSALFFDFSSPQCRISLQLGDRLVDVAFILEDLFSVASSLLYFRRSLLFLLIGISIIMILDGWRNCGVPARLRGMPGPC